MIKHFEREISLIESEDLRMFVKFYLEEYTPEYFWQVGASSSGKYHPIFSQGVGGLVRHTKAVVMFAEELLRMSSYAYLKAEYKDYVIMACILHDTCKYGCCEYDTKAYSDHANNAAQQVTQAWFEYFGTEIPFVLQNAIVSHMGQWTKNAEDRPFTNVDRCVHLADYMASRSFINIPQIVDEWNAIEIDPFALEDSKFPFE